MPLNDGAIFAGFRIVRLLGSGGMGEVYLIRTKAAVVGRFAGCRLGLVQARRLN